MLTMTLQIRLYIHFSLCSYSFPCVPTRTEIYLVVGPIIQFLYPLSLITNYSHKSHLENTESGQNP